MVSFEVVGKSLKLWISALFKISLPLILLKSLKLNVFDAFPIQRSVREHILKKECLFWGKTLFLEKIRIFGRIWY